MIDARESWMMSVETIASSRIRDRKSTRLNSSHSQISYAVFCLKKKHVLLIICLNLAKLMLARSTARGRAVVVRLALGASRRRVVRPMLAEIVQLTGLRAVGVVL